MACCLLPGCLLSCVIGNCHSPCAALSVNLGDNYTDELEKGNVTAQEINNIGFFFIGKQVRCRGFHNNRLALFLSLSSHRHAPTVAL